MNSKKHTNNMYCTLLLIVAVIHSLAFSTEKNNDIHPKDHKNEVLLQIIIGSLVGITEGIINQPIIYAKNTIQQNKKISFNPRVFYRGLGIGVACMAPTTAIQIASENTLKNILPSADITVSTLRALLAGAFSAFASTPTELIVLHQQNSGYSALTTINHLVSKNDISVLYRGFTAKSMRDGIFCAGLLSLYPYFQDFLYKKTNNASIAALGAGIGAGVITTTISHPFDTISTLMQADNNRQKNSIQTIGSLYKNYGYTGFFKGMIPRGTRVILAIPLMNYAKKVYTDLLIPSET